MTAEQDALKDKLAISKIVFGTVIDHIPEKMSFKISEILGLESYGGPVAVIASAKSRTMGSKDIIKIEGKHLQQDEIDKIALIAPGATINMIDGSRVLSKTLVSIPRQITGILRCLNPNCITNNEKMTTRFITEARAPVKVRCIYCERSYGEDIVMRLVR